MRLAGGPSCDDIQSGPKILQRHHDSRLFCSVHHHGEAGCAVTISFNLKPSGGDQMSHIVSDFPIIHFPLSIRDQMIHIVILVHFMCSIWIGNVDSSLVLK